jgi:beta-barrel assembly-enhancing protease
MTLSSLALACLLAEGSILAPAESGSLHESHSHLHDCSACSAGGDGWKHGLPPKLQDAVDRVEDLSTPLSGPLDALRDGDQPALDTAEEKARKALERDIQRDLEMGRKYAEEIAKELKFSEDEALIKKVEKIGAELAEIANANPVDVSWGDRRHAKFPYTFKVVKDKDVNAFSVPGGFIYIYEGLINFAESDDELAGVVAHEISHAAFRHVAEVQRKASKLDLLQIPLIIAALMSRSQEALVGLQGATLVGQSFRSGWSLNAETSADWGAIQYMRKSNYNPVGVLTLMERLGYREQARDWGIYATHPPSRERAQTISARLREMSIPIRRSEVTTSLRATSVIADDQGIDLLFGKTRLHTFRGVGAIERSEEAVKKLNRFADGAPGLEQLGRDGYAIRGSNRPLFEVRQEDLLPGQELDAAFTETLNRLRAVIFDLNFRLWNQHSQVPAP